MTPFSTSWQARDVPVRTLCRLLLIFFAFITPVTAYRILEQGQKNDYFAFRSFAEFVRLYPPGLIYNYPLLEKFQNTWPITFPFSYQPQTLLLVWPLADLPYGLGYFVWMLPGMLLCGVVLAWSERNILAVLAALVGPSALLVWLHGQSSMLAAGLLFGGFALLPRRPAAAGILFGLLVYKPQLGTLVPVALLAARQWRAIASACLTAALLMLASAAAFGIGIWSSWWQHLPTIGATIAAKIVELQAMMATVTANLLVIGATPLQAHVAQAVAAFAVVVLVWRCFRRGVCMLGAALVGAATFLTTPYAFGYDLPVFSLAVIVTVSERWRRGGSFSFVEVAILVLGFLLPWCALSPLMFRFSSLVIGAVAWVILRRLRAVRGEADPGEAHPGQGYQGGALGAPKALRTMIAGAC